MKRTFKYLALTLAAVMLCFVFTGCEGGTGSWNVDLDGNVLDGAPEYSTDGNTVTQKYVVNAYDVSVYGAKLAALRVKRDEYGEPVEVSQTFAVTRYTIATDNALASLLGDFEDTDEVQYVELSYKYGTNYMFDFETSNLESIQIAYRNLSGQTIKVVYNGSFVIQNNTTLDSDTVYEMLQKMLLKTVSSNEDFKAAIGELAKMAYESAMYL